MKTMMVDDEPLMVRSFERQSEGIPGIDELVTLTDPVEALEYARNHMVDLAFLDIEMPVMNGIDLARELRRIHPEILIVFISAYTQYLQDSNRIGADYYIIKPYKRETLEMTMERMRLLVKRQECSLRIRTFGVFTMLKDGVPVPLSGKAKEILALLVSRRGREMSNEEIYFILWEGRPYSNENMKVYFNALRRLKDALHNASIDGLLLSTAHGQMVNTELFVCDYYDYLDGRLGRGDFEGEFLSEYSWSEYLIAELMEKTSF